MTDALIGYTGFVGGNLAMQGGPFAMFNSKNSDAMRGQHFDRVLCAGTPSVKWWANQNPVEDRARIGRLVSNLNSIEAAHFILLSTVDVYRDPVGVDEATIPSSEGLHAYGTNRLMLERFIAERFSNHTIVRLPALVGHGLKKNAVYDLMNDNRLELIHPDSSFQWYPLDRLSADLNEAEMLPTPLNFATEPVSMREIRDRFFPGKDIGSAATKAVHYDFHTRYAKGSNYILSRAQVMAALGTFIGAPI